MKKKKKEIPTKTLVIYLVVSLVLIAGLGVLGTRGITKDVKSWTDEELRQTIIDTCDVPNGLLVNSYTAFEKQWNIADVNTLFAHLSENDNTGVDTIDHERNEDRDIYYASNGSAISVTDNLSLGYERSENTMFYLMGMLFLDNVLYADRHTQQEIPALKTYSLEDALNDVSKAAASIGLTCSEPSTVRYVSKESFITALRNLEQIDASIKVDYEWCDEFYYITIPVEFENVPVIEYTENVDTTTGLHKGQGISIIYSNDGIQHLGIEGAIEEAIIKEANVKYASVSESLDWLIDIMDTFPEVERVEIGDVRFEYSLIRSNEYGKGNETEMIPTWTFYDRGMNVIARFNATDGIRLL